MTIYVSSGRNHASLWTELQNYVNSTIKKGVYKRLIFLVRLQIIKHSFAHLEALLFLIVKVLYEFRLLSSTSQKLSSLLITKFLSPLLTVSFYSI